MVTDVLCVEMTPPPSSPYYIPYSIIPAPKPGDDTLRASVASTVLLTEGTTADISGTKRRLLCYLIRYLQYHHMKEADCYGSTGWKMWKMSFRRLSPPPFFFFSKNAAMLKMLAIL